MGKLRIYSCILLGMIAITANGCKNATEFDGESINPPSNSNPVVNNIKALVTTTDRSFNLTEQEIQEATAKDGTAQTITLQPDVTFQTIDGFGAAITDATAYNLLQMKAENRKKFLEETFSPEKYGFSYIRIAIGCSDFSFGEYTCCDEKGIEHFKMPADMTKYVIPVLKEILQINPTLKIMATPWTCPKWMKVDDLISLRPHDSYRGGSLNPACYSDYAVYFVKWLQDMQKEGIPIFSISPQNEPLNPNNSASLYMPWEQERDFIKTALGPALKKAGLTTRILVFDHNYNYDDKFDQQQYPLKIYADKDAANYCYGAAYHNYGGNNKELTRIHQKAPEKTLLFSEASIGRWNEGRNLKKSLLRDMKELGLETVNQWCKGVIVWNLMLDSDNGPFSPEEGSCKTCYGAVDINNSDYATITRNSHYYVIAHLASVVKPGAIRIGIREAGNNTGQYMAFKNPDNSYAVVLTNETNATKRYSINLGNKSFNYSAPAYSIVSFLWKNKE